MAESIEQLRRLLVPDDIEMLAEIDAELPEDCNVTWRHAGRGTSYRLWVNDEQSEVVTKRVAPLVSFGFARCIRGYRHGHGFVELTDDGRAVLAACDEGGED